MSKTITAGHITVDRAHSKASDDPNSIHITIGRAHSKASDDPDSIRRDFTLWYRDLLSGFTQASSGFAKSLLATSHISGHMLRVVT